MSELHIESKRTFNEANEAKKSLPDLKSLRGSIAEGLKGTFLIN